MEEKLTKEEAEKLYNDTQSSLKLKFTDYYKYSFTFKGENEEMAVKVSLGGDSDYIYREDVRCDEFEAPKTFLALMDAYYDVNITDKKTGKTFNDYHYM